MRNKKCVWPMALALVLLLDACGSADGTKSRAGGSQTKSINEVLASRRQAVENQKAAGTSPETVGVTAVSRVVGESGETPVDLKGTDDTDPDLTKLSATMVFSGVYDIMVNPDSCMGKTIQMRELVAIYHDETKDMNYYSYTVQDVTTHHAQGIEFELADNYHFPDDYPPKGSEITVRGCFDVYKGGEYEHAVLKDAVLEKVGTENEGGTTTP